MRHPMLRGLTIVLALSLATTPTPSFALRAGLEGKTEQKIASALAPAPTAATAPRLDYEQGRSLNTEDELKALRPNDYLGWRTLAWPPGLRYRRVVESWTQDHPAISLKQVNGLGQEINVRYPSVEWPLNTLLALAPRHLTLTTGLEERDQRFSAHETVENPVLGGSIRVDTLKEQGIEWHTYLRNGIFTGPGSGRIMYFWIHPNSDRASDQAVRERHEKVVDLLRTFNDTENPKAVYAKLIALFHGSNAVAMRMGGGLEERRLDYAAGTEITPESLTMLPHGAYVGLLQDGQPRYYQVVMRHDASPIPDARTVGFQPVNEAGQLLNDKGQLLLDEQKQPITELRATTWLPHKAILAAAPKLLKLTAGLEEKTRLQAFAAGANLETEKVLAATATVQFLDHSQGQPLTTEDELKALQPNDYLGWRTTQGPSWQSRQVVRPWTASRPTVALKEVDLSGQGVAGFPLVEWPLQNLLAVAPYRLTPPTGLEEQGGAPAVATTTQPLDYRQGVPLADLDAIHALPQGAYLGLKWPGEALSYYRVSRSWTRSWPTIGLHEVDRERHDAGWNVTWLPVQILERAPVLFAGLEEGQTYRLTGTEGRTFLRALLERGDKVDVQIVASPMDLPGPGVAAIKLGTHPGELLFMDESPFVVADNDRLLVVAQERGKKPEFEITWVGTDGMPDPDDLRIFEGTRQATARQLLRTGLEEGQAVAIDWTAMLDTVATQRDAIREAAQRLETLSVWVDPSLLGSDIHRIAESMSDAEWNLHEWLDLALAQVEVRLGAPSDAPAGALMIVRATEAPPTGWVVAVRLPPETFLPPETIAPLVMTQAFPAVGQSRTVDGAALSTNKVGLEEVRRTLAEIFS